MTGFGEDDAADAIHHLVFAVPEPAGEQFPFISDEHDTRPRLIQFLSCKNVSVSGRRLRDSAMWMQHYPNCYHVRVSGLQIWNH